MGNTEKWTDESPVSFSKTAAVISTSECVILKQDDSWDVVDCTQRKHVLCKRSKRLDTKFWVELSSLSIRAGF